MTRYPPLYIYSLGIRCWTLLLCDAEGVENLRGENQILQSAGGYSRLVATPLQTLLVVA